MNTRDREATIIVDPQNDFWNKNWTLYVNWAEKIIPYVNYVMQKASQKKEIITTSQDWHPLDHISFASTFKQKAFDIINGEVKWPNHCVENTWWADFMEWLQTNLITNKVYKWFDKNIDSYSAFWWNEINNWIIWRNLDEILKRNNVKILNVLWLATDYCDLRTVLDALELWYKVIVHERWIAAVNVNPNDWREAIEKMKKMWAIILK